MNLSKTLKLASSLAIAGAIASSVLAPRAARAEVNVSVHLGLPAAPPLVVVQPGVRVVEDWDEEVYFVRGWYWVRRDGRWLRARHPRAAFVPCEHRHVPATLVRMPPGQYVRYRKHEEKRERKAWKEMAKEDKHERKHGHGGGHGNGHGKNHW